MYFVTVCIADRHGLLWENHENVGADSIRPPEMPPLSDRGKIVDTAVNAITSHYNNVAVANYCIMPDHVHFIVSISSDEPEDHQSGGFTAESGRILSAPTLSMVVGQMKRWVSKQIGYSIWKKSFHDRIIRDEKSFQEIWQYIDDNPAYWQEDRLSEF